MSLTGKIIWAIWRCVAVFGWIGSAYILGDDFLRGRPVEPFYQFMAVAGCVGTALLIIFPPADES